MPSLQTVFPGAPVVATWLHRLWPYLIMLFALGGLWCAGNAHGTATERGRQTAIVRRQLADSSKAIEARIAARAPRIVATVETVTVTRAAHAQAAARITVLSDSTVSIDHGPPVREIPATIAIPEIHTCAAALVADSIAYHVEAAQLEDVTKDRDTWKARAQLDESRAEKPSRFGFKSGLLAGATLVGVVVKLLR